MSTEIDQNYYYQYIVKPLQKSNKIQLPHIILYEPQTKFILSSNKLGKIKLF